MNIDLYCVYWQHAGKVWASEICTYNAKLARQHMRNRLSHLGYTRVLGVKKVGHGETGRWLG